MPKTPPPAPQQTAVPAGRFDDDAWRQWPYALWRLGFEQARRNGDAYVRALPLAARHQRELAAFATRQGLEPLSRDNNPFTNHVVLRQTVREGGANLLRGARAAWEDGLRQWS